jgi:hypothetical protein
MVPSPRVLSRRIGRCPTATLGSEKLSKSCVTPRFDVSSHPCAAAHGETLW